MESQYIRLWGPSESYAPVGLKQAESPSEEKKHDFAPHTSCMWPLSWGHIFGSTLYFQLNSALCLLDSVGWVAGGTCVGGPVISPNTHGL